MNDVWNTAAHALVEHMVFSPRDHSVSRREAWMYGIVCGWGDAIDEVAERHHWSKEAVDELKLQHEDFEAWRKQLKPRTKLDNQLQAR